MCTITLYRNYVISISCKKNQNTHDPYTVYPLTLITLLDVYCLFYFDLFVVAAKLQEIL